MSKHKWWKHRRPRLKKESLEELNSSLPDIGQELVTECLRAALEGFIGEPLTEESIGQMTDRTTSMLLTLHERGLIAGDYRVQQSGERITVDYAPFNHRATMIQTRIEFDDG